MKYQIMILGYNSDGLSEGSTVLQDDFKDFAAVKEKSNKMWADFKKPETPYMQMFITDVVQKKQVFYHSNFK